MQAVTLHRGGAPCQSYVVRLIAERYSLLTLKRIDSDYSEQDGLMTLRNLSSL